MLTCVVLSISFQKDSTRINKSGHELLFEYWSSWLVSNLLGYVTFLKNITRYYVQKKYLLCVRQVVFLFIGLTKRKTFLKLQMSIIVVNLYQLILFPQRNISKNIAVTYSKSQWLHQQDDWWVHQAGTDGATDHTLCCYRNTVIQPVSCSQL